jgi:L-fucose mutarotase/ribose pyranase (RbsD/FucU family)
MLKGIDPILGPELVRMDGHDAIRSIDAILSLMPVDNRVEQAAFRPGLFNDPNHREPIMLEFEQIVSKHEPTIAIVPLRGEGFYDRVRNAYAFQRTAALWKSHCQKGRDRSWNSDDCSKPCAGDRSIAFNAAPVATLNRSHPWCTSASPK